MDISDDGTLTLHEVSANDNGEYICEAENSRGIVRQGTRVLVHGKLGSRFRLRLLILLKGFCVFLIL